MREFALTALQHLKGPAQRPFIALLKSLPPAKQVGVTISTKATKNMQCSGGVCSPTSPIANLNVNDLTRLLGDGSVTVGTTAQAPDVFVNAPFSWTSANGLTVQAIGNVVVNKAVSDAGPAPLTLTYNATGAGGSLSFGAKGHISFMSTGNPLTINGQGYILANNIRLLSQLVARNPSGSFALSASYNAKHDGTYSQSPIETTFQGNFEGLGNRITGFHLTSEKSGQPSGFFARTAASAYVGHLTLEGEMEVVAEGYVGGVIGLNSGLVFQAVFNGTMTLIDSDLCDGAHIGGVAGQNESTGTISFSHATGTMSATGICAGVVRVGGLVGLSYGNADHSWAGMAISITSIGNAKGFIGGLIGGLSGTADEVFATGPLTGSGFSHPFAFFGGLVGVGGSVIHASASGSVTFDMFNASVGGLMGVDGYIEDGVATGAVVGGDDCWCGGAVGDGDNEHDTFSYGMVSAGSNSYLGGFIGVDENPGDLSNDGWCTTSSGITDPSQGAGNVANDPGIAPFTC